MAGNIDTIAIVNPDGSRAVTVRDTGSNDSLNVAIVDASGNQITSFGGGSSTSSTASQSTAIVSTTNVTILASNANRLGATLYNEGSVLCYVKLGSTATTSSYTVKMEPDAYYEVPFNYTGIIQGITSSGTTTFRITEFTA